MTRIDDVSGVLCLLSPFGREVFFYSQLHDTSELYNFNPKAATVVRDSLQCVPSQLSGIQTIFLHPISSS